MLADDWMTGWLSQSQHGQARYAVSRSGILIDFDYEGQNGPSRNNLVVDPISVFEVTGPPPLWFQLGA